MIGNIEIRRPCAQDVKELNVFFDLVIKDTFAKEGIEDMSDEIESEIREKNIHINDDFESNGEKRYFLLAISDGKIIGTIEYGPANDMIIKCTEGKYKNIVEIGTVFVHPEYQKQGIGTLMLNSIYAALQKRNIKEFCLDSGYTRAQKIWKKKFGEPDYIMKNYWAEGVDHMIWKRSISDV